MTKLVALLAALVITALCGVAGIYAMKLSMLVLMHWQAMIAFSALLYIIPVAVVMLRRRRQAKLQAARDQALMPMVRRPLGDL